MPTDKKLKSLVLNVMTEEQYNSATKNEDELYLTLDEGGGGNTQIYTELFCINGGTINTEKSYTIELIYATIE